MSVVHNVVFTTAKMTVGMGRMFERTLYETAFAAYIRPTTADDDGYLVVTDMTATKIMPHTEASEHHYHRKYDYAEIAAPYYPHSPYEY